MARPTAFTEDMLSQAGDYLTKGYKDEGQSVPTVAGLALALNVARSTIYKWCEDSEHPFSDYLEKCNAVQELELINKGLDGTFNSTMAKLILGRHGYSDKQETEHKGDMSVSIASKDAETL